MGNERQLKLATKFVGVRDVNEYRATVPAYVNKDDVVLEVGCEWGTTTALLAQHAREVIGTDVSPDCVERARQSHPGVRFEILDGFDVRAALEFGRAFSKIYIDISGLSGYRSLLDAISLMMMYATVFRPQVIVVKSGALKHFAAHCVAWQPRSAAQSANA
jgi:hypothetical protein